ncbi:MAG: hypothetical protein FD140_4900 [Limisphaerales bacterium]|nr:MAG: hypothetical protein FD140_4900 [Limisphaerales bacterium]
MKTGKKKEISEREADEAWMETLGQARRAKYRKEIGYASPDEPLPVEPAAPPSLRRPVIIQETYSVAEAAAILKVSLVTVYRLIQRGKLRCLQSVRHKRIPRTELERFIKDDLG